jgi:hypothetical protein
MKSPHILGIYPNRLCSITPLQCTFHISLYNPAWLMTTQNILTLTRSPYSTQTQTQTSTSTRMNSLTHSHSLTPITSQITIGRTLTTSYNHFTLLIIRHKYNTIFAESLHKIQWDLSTCIWVKIFHKILKIFQYILQNSASRANRDETC